MSKMSQLHAELSEQAYELGYQSIEEAEADGYVCDFEKRELVDGREYAHREWLKKRDRVLNDLDFLLAKHIFDEEIINRTIEFIKMGEM